MAVKHRCMFCRKVLREDGTCQNQKCPRYTPESQPEPEPTSAEPSEEETK